MSTDLPRHVGAAATTALVLGVSGRDGTRCATEPLSDARLRSSGRRLRARRRYVMPDPSTGGLEERTRSPACIGACCNDASSPVRRMTTSQIRDPAPDDRESECGPSRIPDGHVGAVPASLRRAPQ